MSGLQLPILAGIAIGVGPFLFIRAFSDLRKRRLIQNTPTARIRSMAMGMVEINGQVVQGSGHTAPFSGKPCAYWEVDIATRGRRNSWNVVHRNSSGNPFFVRDDTGLAIVYPHGADCTVTSQLEETCLGISLPACYTEYMDHKRLAFRHVWRLSSLRFRERTLEEGHVVYVLGSARPRSLATEISQEEVVEATGTDGPVEQRLRTLQESASAVISQGDHDPVFIISQNSERGVLLELGLKAWGGLLGGPALTLFGLAYWLIRWA
jgi:hypothetical protein